MIAAHPMRLGPALLHHIKQGKPVEQITVHFTHGQLHQIFSGNTDFGRKLRESYPLEIVLAEGQDIEQRIDCRLFQVPWNIDVRTAAQKSFAIREKAARPPEVTPPEVTQEEQQLADSVFAPFYDLAATEYRLLRQQVERELIRQLKHQRMAQEQSEDTANG